MRPRTSYTAGRATTCCVGGTNRDCYVGGLGNDTVSLPKLDRASEVRLSIDSTTLRATIVDVRNVSQSPTTRQSLYGKSVGIACGTSFRHFGATAVRRLAHWPAGNASLSVRVERDISERAKWCVLEARPGGSDIAFVSFREAEPGRRLTTGRLRDGTPWRLVAWRGSHLQPCISFRLPRSAITDCFDDEAEEEAGLSGSVLTPTCSDETFVLGTTSRSTATVTLRFADNTTVSAQLHRRPPGSRVLAQYFVATIPRPAAVMTIEARDVAGSLIRREPHPDRYSTGDCPPMLPE